MRRYSSALWLFSLFQIFLVGNTYADQVSLDQKIDFLIRQKSFFTLLKNVNHQHLSRYQKCLQNPEEDFTITVIGENAQMKDYTRPCKKLIKIRFRRSFRLHYEKMRLYLALSKTRYRESPEIMSQSNNIDHKLNRDISHPSFLAYLGFNYQPMDLSPLSESETRKALDMYSQDTKDFCIKYKENHLDKRLYFLKNETDKKHLKERFCEESLLKISKNLGHTKFERASNQLNLEQLNRDYHRSIEYNRDKLRATYKGLYEQTISKYPLLIYGKTAHPTNRELLDILEKISMHNTAFNIKVEDYIVENNLETEINSFRQGLHSPKEKEALFENLLFFLKEGIFNAYMTKYTLNSQDSEKIKELVKEKKETIQRTNMFKSLGLLSVALGSCFLPIGKIIKVAQVAKYIKLGCFVSLGIPLNLYFLNIAYHDFNDGLSDVFSSPDGEYIFGDFQQLSSHYQMIVLNTLLLGVGIGPIKEFVSITKQAAILRNPLREKKKNLDRYLN